MDYDVWVHNKTGNKYYLVNDNIINCTNGFEEQLYVLYKNLSGQLFCRERNEFLAKFTKEVIHAN